MNLSIVPGIGVRRPDLVLVWSVVGLAWAITLAQVATGGDYLVSHDDVFGSRSFGWWTTLVLFIASWQLMMAAMMLPSSMPMLVMYHRVSRRHPAPGLMFGVFVLGYVAIWTAFAVVALIADAGVHGLASRIAVLEERPGLIGGTLLILAGLFQFSSLKERCLDECRDPVAFFLRGYAPGAAGAWKLGIRHGVFCLGCCWALMLTMFAIGMGSMVWMTALAGVMLIEKGTHYGRRLIHPIGSALVAWGVIVILNPGWIPFALGAN